MKQDRMRMRRSMDIGRVKRLLDSGKSEAEVYEEFETWYNRRGKNPWWSDKAPDDIFGYIMDVIKQEEARKKAMK